MYPLVPHLRALPSRYLHSQEAGFILIGSTGKEEAGPEGRPGSAEAPATAFVTGLSNSDSLSSEGQDPNPEETSASCPAPAPHASRTQYPRGSALHPHSTHRCLPVQEEPLAVWWCGQHLGRCPQNLGCSCSLACLIQACGFRLA